MPKKTTRVKAKTKTPAKKTAARKGPAKKTTSVKKPANKKTTGKGRGGFHREMNPDTGFVVGTDQDAIATALMEGGESRAAIVQDLEKRLDLTTRNGTDKQITNMISGTLNKMKARGYIIESSFIVLPPTPASKRAATRAANAKPAAKKTTAKKTAAKKTSSKRGARTKRK
jgi:hypothetical protein